MKFFGLLCCAVAVAAADDAALDDAAKPVMTYFKLAGRGEVARLYAVVGGLDIVDSTNTHGYKQKSPLGYLPVVAHKSGGLFPNCTYAMGCLQESLAVERYLRQLAPGYATMTAEQEATDDMFAMFKEDVIQKVEPGAVNKSIAKSLVTPIYDRYLTVVEDLVPADGFVNGLSLPTGADLAVLVLLQSVFPFAKSLQNAGYAKRATFPKAYALADRTAAFPSVAAYLKTSVTFYADPFDAQI